MATLTLESPMGRKKKTMAETGVSSKSDDVAVKYDRVLAEKLKQIVQRRGGTMSRYLSDLTRVIVEKEYAKVIREMADELDGPGPTSRQPATDIDLGHLNEASMDLATRAKPKRTGGR